IVVDHERILPALEGYCEQRAAQSEPAGRVSLTGYRSDPQSRRSQAAHSGAATTSTSVCLADLDGVPAKEPWARRWTQSEVFEWWPIALVALLTIVWLIARTFISG